MSMVHDWRIDPREYARHEERRGRRHAFEVLEPARTALVAIDLVDFFVRDNPYAAGVVPVVNRLARALRVAGGLVTWVVPADVEPTPARVEFYGRRVADLYRSSAGRPWRDLEVREGDPVLEKSTPSAFFPGSCQLPDLLRERGIDTVLVAGTVTNVCVESTVRDACSLDFRVVLVADACAAATDELHNASLRTIYRTFGDVRSAEEVVGLLSGASVS